MNRDPAGTSPRHAQACRVGVVGAGWSGLSAALTLAEAGATVELFESAPVAGGRARTIRLATPLGRFEIDNGQHLIVGAYRDTLALIERLCAGAPPPGKADGAGAPMLERARLALNSASGLRLQAAPLPAPLHLGWALAGARGLGPGGRRAMLRFILGLRLAGWRTGPGETVSALFGRHRQTRQVIDRVWAPLCIGALNTLPEHACAATFAAVLRDTLGGARRASDFMLSDAPLGALVPEPAIRQLRSLGVRIRLRSPVHRIAPGETGGWTLAAAEGDLHRVDALILALAPWTAARLLVDSGLPSGRLAEFESEPIATGWAFWPHDTSPTLPRWQLLDENPARRHFGQWLFDRGLIRSSGAQARLAGIVISLAGRLDGLSGEVIARGLSEQLGETIGGPPPAHLRIVTERRATFRSTPQRPRLHPDHLLSVTPGLWLAGDWLWPDYPATLEAAVRSGRDAAHRLLAHCGPPEAPAAEQAIAGFPPRNLGPSPGLLR